MKLPRGVLGSAIESADRRYRWVLNRRWPPVGSGTVCWIMLNPSTADAASDDPTLRRCELFTSRWGYCGLTVVNLYPFRTPSPAECRRWSDYEPRQDWEARDALMQNEGVVASTAKAADLVVAAWGAGNWDDCWAEQIVETVTHGDAPWPSLHCLGTTSCGAPKHPLARGRHRVPDDQKPVLWRAGAAAEATA